MRVSQQSMYANFLTNMNQATTDLMDINNKAASQKEVNKPSDDPLGTARILNYRDSLASFDQYIDNMDTATGWLKLADDTLVQASDLITRAKEIAEQGATGTLTASDREILSYNMRQLFEQMVSIANTSFGGQSIFAGQNVNGKAYETGLMVYDKDGSVDPYVESITGSSDTSVKVQFLGDGTTGTTGTDEIDYRYTRDGGATWVVDKIAAGHTDLDLGEGVVVSLRNGYEVTGSLADNEDVSVGTWLTVAPTAVYTGSNDDQAAVTLSSEDFKAGSRGSFEQDVKLEILNETATEVTYHYKDGLSSWIPSSGSFATQKDGTTGAFTIELPGGEVFIEKQDAAASAVNLKITVHAETMPVLQMGSDVNAYADGELDRPAMIRIDSEPGVFVTPSVATIEYSYSLDGGRSWVTGKETENTESPEFLVPGASLTLSAKGTNNNLRQGDQFVIQPKSADINVDISADNRLAINNVGSDIFGGSLEYGTGTYHSEDEDGANLFVTMGKLIAALENNDQSGIANGLEELSVAQGKLLNQAADVGARENRLVVSKKILSGLQLSQEEQMSKIEDADIAELMTELKRQEIVYQAVLTSTSRIMKMSLLDYI